MVRDTRRRFLAQVGTAVTVGAAGCTGGGNADDTIRTVLPTGSISYPYGKAALAEGVFTSHGLDVAIEFKPFSAFAHSIGSGDVDVGIVPLVPSLQSIVAGEDLVLFGMAGGLLGINGLYTRTDSEYDTIESLTGERIGVWSWGSSTVQSMQALIAEQTGLSLREDFRTTTAAPAALQGLLDDGEIQATIQVSSRSIAMEARPEQYRRLDQLNNMWLDETSKPLPLTAWVARSSWYDEHADAAAKLVTAMEDATDHWRTNTTEILDAYGEPAQIDDAIEKDVVADWASRGHVFAGGEADQAFVDATWQYLDLMQQFGFMESVPSQEEVLRAPIG